MESEKTIDGGREIRYAARIAIKARVREQSFLDDDERIIGEAIHTETTLPGQCSA